MTHNILINERKIKYFTNVEINKSERMMEDTAKITMPLKLYNRYNLIRKKIKRGNRVSISLGYDDDNRLEFEGYVDNIQADKDFQIHCKDAMFLFYKDVPKKEFKKPSVLELLEYTIRNVQRELKKDYPEVKLSLKKDIPTHKKLLRELKFEKFIIADGSTGYEVLEMIRKQIGINIFVRGHQLNAQAYYSMNEGEVIYDLERNIEKSNLRWLGAGARVVEFTLINAKRPDNKGNFPKVTVGDKGGDKIQEWLYEDVSKAELKKRAEIKHQRYKTEGLTGDITGWLVPYCTYGYQVKLLNTVEDKAGIKYYVEGVDIRFSSSGGERKIYIGKLRKDE